MSKFSFLSLMVALVFAMALPAMAQDDDTALTDDTAADDATDDDDGEGFSGTVEFNSPEALTPSTQFEFNFVVTNTTSADAEGENWINMVEMFMPAVGYVVDADIAAPEALYSGGEWEAELATDSTDTQYITWMFVTPGSSASYGDIREGDYLDFSFTATTDEAATDGFNWRLETSNSQYDTGTAYVGNGPTDDTTDDDAGSDDDDDDDGGCGC